MYLETKNLEPSRLTAVRRWGVKIASYALLAGIWVGGCSKQEDDQNADGSGAAMVIEPNVRVGNIRSGMKMDEVVRELGEPQRRTGNALEYTRLGLAILPNRQGLAQAVMCGDVTGINGPFVRKFRGRTKEGIGMNSTREEVIKAFGPPTDTEKFPTGIESLRYPDLGLGFSLDHGKVHHIIVRLANSQADRTVTLEPEK